MDTRTTAAPIRLVETDLSASAQNVGDEISGHDQAHGFGGHDDGDDDDVEGLSDDSADYGLDEGSVARAEICRVAVDKVELRMGDALVAELLLSDARDADGEVELRVGDTLEVFIDRLEAGKPAVVSRVKAKKLAYWNHIAAMAGTEAQMQGTIIAEVKGGLSVDLGGVRAFLPASQIDDRPINDLKAWLGRRLSFNIIEFHSKRGNIVVSRRALAQKLRESKRRERLMELSVGDELEGVVRSFAPYGAFVDLGGVDGLLRNQEMAWARVNKPEELLTLDQKVRVKVLSVDVESGRIGLGMRQLAADPWQGLESTTAVGDTLTGKVVSLTKYGAFVEVAPGVEGLVHVSELSWTKRISHPKELLQVGDEVQVKVLDIDLQERRLSLGLRQTQDNPWEALVVSHPVGTRLKARVGSVADFGIFVNIQEGIDGLVHVSDMSWTEKIHDPSERFQVGDEIEVVVLGVDAAKQRVSLGIKQLEEDPWDVRERLYKRGTKVLGKVSKIAPYGVFVTLDATTEGLCHISELSTDRVERAEDIVKLGDDLEALVIDFDRRKRRIGLSVKALLEGDGDYQQYLAKQEVRNEAMAEALRPVAERMAGEGGGSDGEPSGGLQ